MRRIGYGKMALLSALCIMLALSGGCAAESEDSAAADQSGRTVFAEYLWSLNAQEQVMEFVFFSAQTDTDRWTEQNIEEVSVKIGEETASAQVTSVSMQDEILYDRYYRGTICLTVDFSSFSGHCGEASLCVLFSDEAQVTEYDLGSIAVVPEALQEDAVITQLVTGGVVREDDEENVMTYGIIAHLNAAEAVEISSMSFGLDSAAVLSDEAVLYSYEEYQDTVYAALENTTFDELVSDAYLRTTVTDPGTQCALTLDAGEYYIYLPVGYASGTDAALIQAALVVEYTAASSAGTYVSSSNPYFSEFTKSQTVLEEMFD